MSLSAQELSAAAAAFQSDLTWNYATVSSLALAGYEYFFTLDHEVKLLWQSNWTAATWFFVANRYFMLVTVIIAAVPYTYQLFLCALDLIPVIIAAAFSALRVYALMNKCRYIMSGIVMFLGLIPVIVNAYYAHWVAYQFVSDPVLGEECYTYFGPAVSAAINLDLCRYVVSLAGRLSLIVADVIVLIVTWTKTFEDVRQATAFRLPAGLPATLLRDGSMYFLAMLVLNIAQLVLSSIPALLNANPITTIAQVVQAILIGRFLVNLRDTRSIDEEFGSTNLQASVLSTLNFNGRSIVGNMGEPLNHEHDSWDIELHDLHVAPDNHDISLRHEASDRTLVA